MPCATCTHEMGLGDIALGSIGDINLGSWTDVAKTGAQTGFDILKGVFDPRYRPGTVFQQTPEGGVAIQRATAGPSAGFQLSTFPGQQFSPGSSQLLQWGLIFGAVVIGINMLGGKK